MTDDIQDLKDLITTLETEAQEAEDDDAQTGRNSLASAFKRRKIRDIKREIATLEAEGEDD